jgi:hypothetical protein
MAQIIDLQAITYPGSTQVLLGLLFFSLVILYFGQCWYVRIIKKVCMYPVSVDILGSFIALCGFLLINLWLKETY